MSAVSNSNTLKIFQNTELGQVRVIGDYQNMKIQYSINGTWVMYSQYSNLGYESIKQEVLDNGTIIYNRRITGIGREFILSLFGGEK
ncbi:phage antirepressor KilAC domain-containing protein [Helicobacter sp. 13S00482-2]|uniref:phage antirepressor KilAC domain-containing protein n=1 Tax=Helicobacter sp. 13S00482-2 TaxID=1476200 RepID=UPI001C5CD39C|nr:phage antirepressor KilAC domain-containing protein [Helicobacter sp. 13S00482-2]